MAFDPLAQFPGYALRRASHDVISGLMDRLSTLDLRLTEASTLVVIHANDGVPQSEAARLLNIASANMTPLVAKLEARGLVSRQRIDGRSQALHLTPEGEALAKRALNIMTTHEKEMLARVPEHLQQPFREALRHLWR